SSSLYGSGTAQLARVAFSALVPPLLNLLLSLLLPLFPPPSLVPHARPPRAAADATGMSAVEHARDNGTMGALTAPLRRANPDATADEAAAAAATEEAVERENHWVEAWGSAADGTALLRVYPVYREGRAPPGEERANVTAMRNACRGYMSALVDFTSLVSVRILEGGSGKRGGIGKTMENLEGRKGGIGKEESMHNGHSRMFVRIYDVTRTRGSPGAADPRHYQRTTNTSSGRIATVDTSSASSSSSSSSSGGSGGSFSPSSAGSGHMEDLEELMYEPVDHRLGPGESDNYNVVAALDLGDPSRQHEMRCRYTDFYVFPFASLGWALVIVTVMALVGYMWWAAGGHMQRLERDFLRMQLLKNKMKAARNVAERASVAKGTFLATMSHELRTPMNGVIGMLNLLLETPLSITQLDYVETAHTSGRALLELINDILDLSKIEANKMPLESVAMDVRAQVDTVLTMFVERFRAKPLLEVAAYIDPWVPQAVLGDSLRLRQVLVNLLSNAFKSQKPSPSPSPSPHPPHPPLPPSLPVPPSRATLLQVLVNLSNAFKFSKLLPPYSFPPPPPSPPPPSAHRATLLQVLVNLLSNAFKFTERGHIFIAVRTALPSEDLKRSFRTRHPSHSHSHARTHGHRQGQGDDGEGGRGGVSIGERVGVTGRSSWTSQGSMGGCSSRGGGSREAQWATLSGLEAVRSCNSWDVLAGRRQRWREGGAEGECGVGEEGTGEERQGAKGEEEGAAKECVIDVGGDGAAAAATAGAAAGGGGGAGSGDGEPVLSGPTVRLVITVEDTGEGIPKAAQKSILKPFTQADASTTRTHGGTGIGLSISRHLVALMGGKLAFSSRPGVGTTFYFDILVPLAVDDTQQQQLQQPQQGGQPVGVMGPPMGPMGAHGARPASAGAQHGAPGMASPSSSSAAGAQEAMLSLAAQPRRLPQRHTSSPTHHLSLLPVGDALASPRLLSPCPARVSTSLNTSPRLLPPSSTSPCKPSSARHNRNPSLQLLKAPLKELHGMQAAQLRLLQSTPVHRLTASPIHMVPMSPLPLLQHAEASLTHFDALLLDDKPVRFGITESLLGRLGIPVRNTPLPRDLQSLFSSASSTHAAVSQLQGLRPVIVVVEGEWLERLKEARKAGEEGGTSGDEDSGGRDSPCTPRMGVPLQQQRQRERREGGGGSSRGVLSWQQVAARLFHESALSPAASHGTYMQQQQQQPHQQQSPWFASVLLECGAMGESSNGADGGRAGSRAAAAEEGGAPFHGTVCKPVRFSALSACLSQLLLGATANQDSGEEEGDEAAEEEGTGFVVSWQGGKAGNSGCAGAGDGDDDDGDGCSKGRRSEGDSGGVQVNREQGKGREAGSLRQGSEGGASGLSGKQAVGGSAAGRGGVQVKKGKQSKTAQLLCEKLGGRRFLVVDDNMVNRKVMSKMLERYDVHVEAVDGGAKAIAAVARTDAAATPYDCVFMDLQMPGMDGLEATGLIRKYEAEQQAKEANPQQDAAAAGAKRRLLVIALTADVGAGTKEKCVGAGMDGYMTKPIEEDQLSRTLLPFFDG
ncbi:unnamed protein product, partial [Closterium sp. Naga37s-1]